MRHVKPLHGTSLLTLRSLSAGKISALLDDAQKEKSSPASDNHLFSGKSLALLFSKPSTRTRAAFEVAFGTKGGQVSMLDTTHQKESLLDAARVLGRMYDVIAYRGHRHEALEDFAEAAEVPVINALTDSYHPTQALADLMTLREEFQQLSGLTMAYFGDGRNNVATSLLIGASLCKVGLYYVCPPSLQPDRTVLDSVDTTNVILCDKVEAVPTECHAVYTDVWTSMGEDQTQEKEPLLRAYQVNDAVMKRFPQAIFLHCLPAVRGKEVSASVIDGNRSRVWQQAENRCHTIKTVLKLCLGLL